ncbi:sensor histidine kinase [Corynebacterium mastitidis]|uniref:sensor histidine kinase n=1 Tax=Corynebacterium mastitidis TaxID=161890 RepID=UPI002111B7D9|nr:histidine kinase [Corynebacterium mastitidis]
MRRRRSSACATSPSCAARGCSPARSPPSTPPPGGPCPGRLFPISLAVSLLVPPLYVFSTLSSAWAIRLIAEAERAAELQRHLILAEERLRFAQEMHDTLGQRLAAINIKAELAIALARRDDDRFHSELSKLRGLAATSVSEMHNVVRGYRDIDIATEIEEARRLLRAGGIALSVEGHPHDLPEAHRELAAWLVREATTNILRHSEATAASLRMSDACLAISNNNPGTHLGSPRAGGLDALRRRAARQGALLIVDSRDEEFHVKLLMHKEGAQ